MPDEFMVTSRYQNRSPSQNMQWNRRSPMVTMFGVLLRLLHRNGPCGA